MLGIRNECTGPSAWQVPVRRTWRAAHLGLCAAIQGHDLHRALLLHQPARRSGQVHVYVAAAGPKVPLPHGAGLVAHKHQVVAHAHVHDALLDVRREALEGPASCCSEWARRDEDVGGRLSIAARPRGGAARGLGHHATAARPRRCCSAVAAAHYGRGAQLQRAEEGE